MGSLWRCAGVLREPLGLPGPGPIGSFLPGATEVGGERVTRSLVLATWLVVMVTIRVADWV